MIVHLSSHRVPGSDCSFYIPNFVTEDEEKYLIQKVLIACNSTSISDVDLISR